MMDIARYKTDIIHFLEHEYFVPDSEKLIDFSEWQWQRYILKDIFETKDADGKRLYTGATVSTPRQQGKSLILQCVGLYMLIAGGKNLNIFSIACDKDQAALVPERVKKAIRLNPRLRNAVTITKDVITCPANGNSWTIMSSDQASSTGIIGDVLLWDELGMMPEHQWNLVYLLLPSMSARREPLMMIASTVGEWAEGPLESFMELGRDEDEEHTYLFESNEILSPLSNLEQIERDKKLMPEAVWLRMYHNLIVEGSDSFLNDEDIEDMIIPEISEAWPNKPRYLGCDWGLTKDKCAIVNLVEPARKVRKGRAYIAGGDHESVPLHKKPKKPEPIFPEGFLFESCIVFRGSRKNPVDLNEATDAVRELYRPGSTRKVFFDKWQSIGTIQQLQKEWSHRIVEGFDFTSGSRTHLFQNLFSVIRGGKLKVPSDILRKCWRQSCQVCDKQSRCKDKNAHDFLRELQGLRCDSNFRVSHGKRGDDIAVATGLALMGAIQKPTPTKRRSRPVIG